MKLSIRNINHFNIDNCNNLISCLSDLDPIPTVSLCHICYEHVPAYTYNKDNQFWLSKKCQIHGITHHMIERDYEFIHNIPQNDYFFNKKSILYEVSDRCNIACPHCYHMPDNSIIDKPIISLMNEFNETIGKDDISRVDKSEIILAGAEASMHKNFIELIKTIKSNYKNEVSVMTNGIRFSNKKFLDDAINKGLYQIHFGLNHPSYIGNKSIRDKQLKAISYSNDYNIIGYIGYTMSSMSELIDILEESTRNNWKAMIRIRYGSDIGRYPDQPRMYVSDIFKITKDWCEKNNKTFEIVPADNNIYHVMVKIDQQLFRLIQWCDVTDIHMEELMTGPYCNFVPDGVTNFLHQIIRRDFWKNQGNMLLDSPPQRYVRNWNEENEELDFLKLYE